MRATRRTLAAALIALACIVPLAARAASLGVGTVNVTVNLNPLNTGWMGTLTFADETRDLFGTPINPHDDIGTIDIVNGELQNFTGAGGGYAADFESATPGVLNFQASGSFLCGTGGCLSGGPHSLVGATDTFTGSFASTLTSFNPPVTYTGDLSISCMGSFPILTCSGPIGINAFRSIVTNAGTNVIVQALTTYFNSKTAADITLPITITFAGVPTGGFTLVTASSANAGMLPAGYMASTPDFPASFFDVTTSGFTPTPPFKLCVDFKDDDGDGFIDGTGVKIANLRLLHGQGGVFGDFTITANVGPKQACAVVDTLSPFIVAVVADTTTTTTLPGSCTQDANCTDDGDPCFTEACIGGSCASTNVQGLPGALCVCNRPTVAACVGQVPANVNAQLKKACKSISKAQSAAANTKKAKKLLKAASKAFKKGKTLAAKAAKKKKKPLSTACATALDASLGDAQKRTDSAGAGL